MREPWQETMGSFRAAFQAAPLGVALISADEPSFGRFLDVNPALCAITGYTADHLLSVRFQAITHPDDVQRGVDLARRATSGEVPAFELEKRYIHAGGHVVWVRLFASLIAEADGTPVCFLTHVLDATEAKRTEAALPHREQQLKEAQQLARLGSWEWEMGENTIVWSDELYRIFGVAPQEFQATYEGFLSHVHPKHREMVNRSVARALESNVPFEVELDVLRPDGSIRACRALGRVVRDEQGNPVRMHGTNQDITEAKATEAALRNANARLRLLHVIATAANDGLI